MTLLPYPLIVIEPSSVEVTERGFGGAVVTVVATGEEVGVLVKVLSGIELSVELFTKGSTVSVREVAVEGELLSEPLLISWTSAATPKSKAIVRTSSLDWFGTTRSRIKRTSSIYGNSELFKALLSDIDPGVGPTLKG